MGCLAITMLACSLDDILFPKTFYVTKTADTADGECSPDDCSLREAVIASNETAGHNEIIVPAGTYILSIPGIENAGDTAAGGDLDITDGVDIHGDLWETTVDGNASHKIFTISEGRRVEIRGLTIQNGDSYTGGGILNAGDLTIIDSTVANNSDHIRGGGIANGGTLILRHTSVMSNNSDGSGGGIYNGWGGTLQVKSNSFISGNTAADFGGGIFNEYASKVEISSSTITQNAATNGGGIANQDELDSSGALGEQATLFLADAVISNNSAGFTGGGVYNAGSMVMAEVEFNANSANYGGGLYNIWDELGDLAEGSEVVFNDNTAYSGGGVYDNGRLYLDRSAVINNNGGGLRFDEPRWGYGGCALGNAVLVNMTVSNNSNAGLSAYCSVELTNLTVTSNEFIGVERFVYGTSGGSITIRNTIIAGNGTNNCYGSLIVSDGHNLESTNTCGFTSPGDLVEIDPMLDVLQEISGTFAHPLLTGSPAIDTGDNAGCPATDQRGAPRPFGSTCDIGAYEFGAPVPIPRQVTPTSIEPTGTLSQDHTSTPTWTPPFEPTDTPTKELPPIVTNTLTPTPLIVTLTKRPIEPAATPTLTPFIVIVTKQPVEPTATPTLTPFIVIITKRPIEPTASPIQ